MAKDVNKRKSIRHAKTVTEIVISAVIIAMGAYAVKTTLNRSSTVGTSPYMDVAGTTQNITEASTEAFDPNKIIFENKSFATKDKFKGDLILVNEDYEYFGGDEDLVSINGMIYDEEINCLIAYDDSAQIRSHVCRHLIDMMVGFNEATNYDDVLIEGAFRTNAEQQQLYDEDLELTGEDYSTRVALPGHSEHECGYALDFGINDEYTEYDGTGEYDWINKNCWKYGFILRYTEDKTDITKIKYEPWHYRYVGVPHAYYIYSNNLCLEEYVEFLKTHPYDGDHLKFKDDNGVNYEVYYVASDDGNDNTSVPVPSNRKYEISGNNADGFVVVVYTDEKTDGSQQAETSTAAPTTEDEENSDGDSGDENSDDSGSNEDSGNEDDSDLASDENYEDDYSGDNGDDGGDYYEE